ncbi:MAG TPA: UV DNA damage repair endonuclease UvsE [Syntrophomonadaceae bacterium]|nr:UV DNA damage repair endonuclease UvsE [Syntrophomonadaceae bacterium]
MRIGYACLTAGVPDTEFKSCILKNASAEKLRELIAHNLKTLDKIIDYNIANQIYLFRISSDLIPFGSSPVNRLPWYEDFSRQFAIIGQKIQKSKMRVSMHPGQYTVLNSPDVEVAKRAVADLEYHDRILDSLGLDEKHKIVLHIGGVYKDKSSSARRFISHYGQLDEKIKNRLVIENDDRSYNIADVLEISQIINAPVVYDNLHDQINSAGSSNHEREWIDDCRKTWGQQDGPQKIHYSQQDPCRQPGSHSSTINIDGFMQFYEKLSGSDTDIMLEVKDKNLSAIKCINCTTEDQNITRLESEWSKYIYTVLERSQAEYRAITKLLKNKKQYPAIGFYDHLDKALRTPIEKGNAVNAAQHVWGYFKDVALTKEKDKFLELMEKYQQGELELRRLKTFLHRLATKYQQDCLLDSYYFVF